MPVSVDTGMATELQCMSSSTPGLGSPGSGGREMEMKRIVIFGSSLAFVLACAKAPEAKSVMSDALASPVASAATATSASASAPATSPGGPSADAPSADATTASASVREITLPRGTVLPVTLDTSIGSDISHVEQPVQGHLRHAVMHNGVEVLPAGAGVSGYVTSARRPGRVKGRGYVAVRFTEITLPGESRQRISTSAIGREAPATKGKDAVEILAPAAGGAVVGRLVGGKKGAAEGAVIGGAAGTGYVLATRGKDVRVSKGAPLTAKLNAPATLRVR